MTATTHTLRRSLLCLGGSHGVCNVSEELIEHCFCSCHISYEHRPKSKWIMGQLAFEFWSAGSTLPFLTDQQIGDAFRAVNVHYYGEDHLTQVEVDAFVRTLRTIITPGSAWSLFDYQDVLQENLANLKQGKVKKP